MTKEAFKEVLLRYVEGTASPLEEAYVEKWYEGVEELQDNTVPNSEAVSEEIFSKIKAKITQKSNGSVFTLQMFYRVAAVLVLVAGSILAYQYFQKTKSSSMVNAITPGSEKAILKLADGTEIALDSTNKGDLLLADGTKISRLEDGTLVYIGQQGQSDGEVKYNEMKIPAGGRFTLQLPDGSMVWLNSVSAIKFPTKFTGKERKVYLEGEAYFEVKHNASIPFIVEVSDKQSVKVLGTEFNISAYKDDAEVKTTLLQGSVKVTTPDKNTVMLSPGQQAVVKRGVPIKAHSNVNMDMILAWKNGFFLFKNTDIVEITRQLSRWYNVPIHLDPKLKGQTFSGKLPQKDDVRILLKMFETTNMIDCEIKNNAIEMKTKK